MKKILLPLFVIYGSCAFAQKSFFGVEAGVNVSTIRVKATDNLIYPAIPSTTMTIVSYYRNTTKPALSFFYQIGFSESLALRAQATYMGMGYKDVYSTSNIVEIDYLTFPISIQYSANKHLSFGAGPYLSFTLGGTEINSQPITKTYHKNDFGFFIGGEHDVYKNFALGVKYFVGTKNILLDDQNGMYKRTNRALQFTVIYKFKKTN